MKVEILELGLEKKVPSIFLKGQLGHLGLGRSPHDKKGSTWIGIHDVVAGPASIRRLVLPVVDIGFGKLARNALNLISLLDWYIIRPLFVRMLIRVLEKVWTFVFENLP